MPLHVEGLVREEILLDYLYGADIITAVLQILKGETTYLAAYEEL